jgi:HTH-type transcriptional regulator/antitoxin HigA
MTDHDDFPLSPDCWADSSAFYEAFLKAEQFLAAVPAKSRGDNADRLLQHVTNDLYSTRKQKGALLRAAVGAAEAGAAVWLSKVRAIAQWFCASTEVPPFAGLSKEDLVEIARLSADVRQLASLEEVLLARGIVLVHERAIPGVKVDGAVFKLRGGNPVIGLSLRYPRLDHYWFTLMHELAHVVLHDALLTSPIIDDLDGESSELIEKQANRLASNSFIPSNLWRSCPAKYSLKEADVHSFAESLGIAPHVVAGRLRRELGRHDLFSALINTVDVREVLLGKN